MVIIYILTIGIGAFLIWDKTTRKYIDKYNSVCMFGKKGVGKTSTLQKLVYMNRNKFDYIFSNIDLVGAIKIDGKKIGKEQFPPNSLVLIDEIGILFPSRDFKNFGLDRIEWFKKQRHNKVKLISCSQSYNDTDRQLRDLYDELWLLKKHFRVLTVAKQIMIDEDIANGYADENGSIQSGGTIVKKYSFGFKRIYVWLPHWIKLFDSFEMHYMPKLKWDKVNIEPELLKKMTFKWYVMDIIKRSAYSLSHSVKNAISRMVAHQKTFLIKCKCKFYSFIERIKNGINKFNK